MEVFWIMPRMPALEALDREVSAAIERADKINARAEETLKMGRTFASMLGDMKYFPGANYHLGEDDEGYFIVATKPEGTHLWTAKVPLEARVNEALKPSLAEVEGEVRLLVDLGNNGVKQPAFVRVNAISGKYLGTKDISNS